MMAIIVGCPVVAGRSHSLAIPGEVHAVSACRWRVGGPFVPRNDLIQTRMCAPNTACPATCIAKPGVVNHGEDTTSQQPSACHVTATTRKSASA